MSDTPPPEASDAPDGAPPPVQLPKGLLDALQSLAVEAAVAYGLRVRLGREAPGRALFVYAPRLNRVGEYEPLNAMIDALDPEAVAAHVTSEHPAFEGYYQRALARHAALPPPAEGVTSQRVVVLVERPAALFVLDLTDATLQAWVTADHARLAREILHRLARPIEPGEVVLVTLGNGGPDAYTGTPDMVRTTLCDVGQPDLAARLDLAPVGWVKVVVLLMSSEASPDGAPLAGVATLHTLPYVPAP